VGVGPPSAVPTPPTPHLHLPHLRNAALSDLLGAEVLDEHGRAVGKVHDVRVEQAGPELAGFGPSLRVQGLIVGRRALGARFGFGRGVRGPSLLKLVFGSLGHDGRYVAWDRIRSIRGRQIRIIGTTDDLPRPQPSDA
jgi:hypothetical protein